jgi:hypothetical protein
MCVRTYCHDIRMDATLNSSNLLDTNGRPDARQGHQGEILGSDFSEVESAQNILGHLENFSKINNMPDYLATLHNSDFVKQNATNTN